MTVFFCSTGDVGRRALLAMAVMGICASAPARAAEPSPEAVALAARVLDDVGLKATIDAVVPYMFAELEHSFVATHPEMKTAMHDTLVTLAPEFAKSESGVLDDVAHVMASGMTEAELKDTITFFESTAGKKYVREQGPVLRQLNVSGEAWRSQLSSTLLPRVREEMKKKGFEF